MRKLPPLTELRAFEAAARHLSFKMAAAELYVTPTAISHQIKLLERYCGRALFRRRPRPLKLTTAGEQLFPVIRDGFQTFADVLATVRPNDLWIADRNFCAKKFLFGLAAAPTSGISTPTARDIVPSRRPNTSPQSTKPSKCSIPVKPSQVASTNAAPTPLGRLEVRVCATTSSAPSVQPTAG